MAIVVVIFLFLVRAAGADTSRHVIELPKCDSDKNTRNLITIQVSSSFTPTYQPAARSSEDSTVKKK